jgi:simple sugar transport system substrate-binding protein
MWRVAALLVMTAMIVTACGGPATPTAAPETQAPPPETQAPPETEAPVVTEAPPEEFVFGLLMVGPYNDHGWSQAHYEAGLYVEEHIPGARMIYIDKVNTSDRPGTTPAQLAEDLLAQGAQLIIFSSDDMKDGATEFATAHPEIPVIHASGDVAWAEGMNYLGLPNMVNVMPRAEDAKHIAGCAAALTTQTGRIGYLGPLINDETRRLASSAYLGARYCWTEILGRDPADLEFSVVWIGFWFNIPGFTADPTQVADTFYNGGYDVVISGIDTTEGLVEARRITEAGNPVFDVAYDYERGCDEAPEVCLGAAYFNWRPFYLRYIQAAIDGTFAPTFEWLGPDWTDINNLDTSYTGFVQGPGLSAEASAKLDQFIALLAGGLNLWTGPLNLQDGAEYLADGVVATPQQVWYLPQLLEGMEGQSVPPQ